MNLTSVISIFKKHKTLSISQLSLLTGEDKNDLSFVITELTQRGKISPIDTSTSCNSGCKGCSVASFCSTQEIYYKWNE